MVISKKINPSALYKRKPNSKGEELKQLLLEDELRGSTKAHYEIKGMILSCESCKATLVESNDKNMELEMSRFKLQSSFQ